MYCQTSPTCPPPCGPFCTGCELCCDIVFCGEEPQNKCVFGERQTQVCGDDSCCAKSIAKAIEDVQKRTENLHQKIVNMEHPKSGTKSTMKAKRNRPVKRGISSDISSSDSLDSFPNRSGRDSHNGSKKRERGCMANTDSTLLAPSPPAASVPSLVLPLSPCFQTPVINNDPTSTGTNADAMKLCLIMMEEIKSARVELSKSMAASGIIDNGVRTKKSCSTKRANKDENCIRSSELQSMQPIMYNNEIIGTGNCMDAMKLCLIMMDEIRAARAELSTVMSKCMAATVADRSPVSPGDFSETILDDDDVCVRSRREPQPQCSGNCSGKFSPLRSLAFPAPTSQKLCNICSNRSNQPQRCTKPRATKCKNRCKCGKPCRTCCDCGKPGGECVCPSQKRSKFKACLPCGCSCGFKCGHDNKCARPTRCKSCKSCCFTAVPRRNVFVQPCCPRNQRWQCPPLCMSPPRRCPKSYLARRTWCCWPCV